MAVASAGPYASLHLAPDRQPRQHPATRFLQAGCPSCRPTNSVKALKAQYNTIQCNKIVYNVHLVSWKLECEANAVWLVIASTRCTTLANCTFPMAAATVWMHKLLTCVQHSLVFKCLAMLNVTGIPCGSSTPLLPQISDATDGRGPRTDEQWPSLYQL